MHHVPSFPFMSVYKTVTANLRQLTVAVEVCLV